ncbi:NUDIX hydrolase [Peribacillus muralis]|uniref:NUDIX hydrolase n=1 Tax=Peribacillus muralis TaxID=264697 RepID=A0A1B3XNI5_9BACI|nr:NUDIX domain-containing protein [Peribacillus muralis]AOH54781.1 NUDIX hydrolase [Peribacillus muralis]
MGEQEMLKIFNENKQPIGVASRSDVHRLGYWHEVFHCWFIINEHGMDYIYLQLRSENKKDYPNLLDITAAGHLLADESVEDGVREIKEEIGIEIAFEELVQLGVIEYCVVKDNFIDKELANAFLYKSRNTLDDFTLQVEEVSGIVKAKFNDFSQLWFYEKNELEINGFEVNKDGKTLKVKKYVNRNNFVPHQISFYQEVIQKIKERIC